MAVSKKRKHHPVKKKRVGKAHYKVYHEVKRVGKRRKGHRSVHGRMGSMSDVQAHKNEALRILKDRLAFNLVMQSSATKASVKNSLKKAANELRKEIRVLEGKK